MKAEPVKFEAVKVGEGWGVSVSVGGQPVLVLVTQAANKGATTELVAELERLVDEAITVS